MAEVVTEEETKSVFTIDENSSEMMGYAAHLAQVIGARPAGTEEEQQASFYIEQLLKDGAGLKTEVEEFNCNSNFELPKVVCCIVTVVLAILSIALPLTVVPAIILTLITGALFVLESLGISVLGKLSKRGISQNVVGKYIPKAPEGAPVSSRSSRRKRKIILVAHYDTGKVRAELKGAFFNSLNVIHWIEFCGMILVPVALLIRLASNANEGALVFFNILIIVGAIASFLPVFTYVMHQTAQYNNGANCNAAGVAVMAEVARRIGRELPVIDFSSDVVMNGEEAARELLPEGASLTYDDGRTGANAVQDDAEGVAPIPTTGAGVDAIFGEISEEAAVPNTFDAINAAPAAAAAATAATAATTIGAGAASAAGTSGSFVSGAQTTSASGAASASTGEPVTFVSADITQTETVEAAPQKEEDNVPDWFKRGLQKANEHKPEASDHGPSLVQRSRFADALDNAAATAAEAQSRAQSEAQAEPSAVEKRLQQMRESIMGQVSGSSAYRSSATDGRSAGTETGSAVQAADQGDEAQATQGAQAQAAEQNSAVQNTGVDGYLSSAMDAPDYATSTAQAPVQVASAEVAGGASISQSTQAAQAAVDRQAAQAQQVQQAELEEAARAAEKAAIADRTIGFIPVPVDQDELAAAGLGEGTSVLSSETGQITPVGESAAAGSATSAQTASAPVERRNRKKREIALPSLTGAIEGLSAKLQNAPIAEDAVGPDEQKANAERLARQENLAKSHAAATGNIPSIESPSTSAGSSAASASATGSVNVTAGAFIDASGTSSFQPVGDELIADVAEDDIYIEDADDSDYIDQFTSQGAPVGPGYVDMPTSRASKMFGKFRRNKKKKNDEVSLKESLGLSDDFDARSVGKARGGWESFRDESLDDFSSFDDEDWDGGAFSKLKQSAMDGVSGIVGKGSKPSARRSTSEESSEFDAEYVDEYGESYDGEQFGEFEEEAGADYMTGEGGRRNDRTSARSRRGEGSSRTRRRSASPFGDLPLNFSENQMEEREVIQQLNSGALSTEVWFVALGAEVADNAGIREFISHHADELKGSVIVDLNGLGAGTLSVIEEEGMFRPIKVSSRLKRYATKAASSLGMRVSPAKMLWRDSAAYVAARHGYQTLHIAGILNGKPAYCGEADDVIENLNDDTLRRNADFVMELVRNI